MSAPDLGLTARLVGLPLPQLWSRYLAVGGSSSLPALGERVAGRADWSPREELFLAVALNDALIDDSLVALSPLEALLGRDPAPPPSVRARDAPGGPPPGSAGHPTAADLAALLERCRATRESARAGRALARAASRRATANRLASLARAAESDGAEPDAPLRRPRA